MPRIKWFEGLSLSYAEHLFRYYSKNNTALILVNEEKREEIKWSKLEREVKAIRSFLKDRGVKKGDVVAAYLPNIPQTISAFIAVNSLGAVWTCCSPDFGVETVIERFSQCAPKCLIACNGYTYNGRRFDKQDSVIQLQKEISSIDSTVLVSYIDSESKVENSFDWEAIVNQRNDDKPLDFEKVPFSHPIWILYSSGTTGKPKAITHSHGGTLLEHLKYMSLQNDVKKGEKFFWFSTTGWMMWNFLQSSMLVGAIPVLFDGSPAYPSLVKLWEMADQEGIHHFGTSAPYLTACMNEGLNLKAEYSLSDLRSIGSTGAPLPDDAFDWVYENVKTDLWLCSMSGGTDVCTAFVGSSPYEPVYQGFIQSRALGAALYAYDENGNQVTDSLGEMVIEKPMPSMPIYYWGDNDYERYTASYFEEYSGKWRHGDWIKIKENGSLTIHGRSDATLNRNGIRIGTAEIYNVLNKIDGINDSLIVNIDSNERDLMPLFIVLEENHVLDENMKKAIIQSLRTKCSPRHVPTSITKIPDIPYTLSGKKMEYQSKNY